MKDYNQGACFLNQRNLKSEECHSPHLFPLLRPLLRKKVKEDTQESSLSFPFMFTVPQYTPQLSDTGHYYYYYYFNHLNIDLFRNYLLKVREEINIILLYSFILSFRSCVWSFMSESRTEKRVSLKYNRCVY